MVVYYRRMNRMFEERISTTSVLSTSWRHTTTSRRLSITGRRWVRTSTLSRLSTLLSMRRVSWALWFTPSRSIMMFSLSLNPRSILTLSKHGPPLTHHRSKSKQRITDWQTTINSFSRTLTQKNTPGTSTPFHCRTTPATPSLLLTIDYDIDWWPLLSLLWISIHLSFMTPPHCYDTPFPPSCPGSQHQPLVLCYIDLSLSTLVFPFVHFLLFGHLSFHNFPQFRTCFFFLATLTHIDSCPFVIL